MNVYEAGTGAVRSNDLAEERWDLLSGAACSELHYSMDREKYDDEPYYLVDSAIDEAKRFLGYHGRTDDEPRIRILSRGWSYLATAIQILDAPKDELEVLKCQLETRSEFRCHYPYYALKRAARTCYEGATKYSEENWHNGFNLKDLANHTIAHMISWSNGRRPLSSFWKGEVEDELGHAMWGFMATTHTWLFRQDKCSLLLGKNYSITEELKKYHQEHASRREVKPATADDRYWDKILEKEEETRKRVATKTLMDAIDQARGGPAPVPRMAHA